MTKAQKLTTAQQRAVDWLAEQPGVWRKAPGGLGGALLSLHVYHPVFVEMREGGFGPEGGFQIQYRSRLRVAS